MRKDDEYEIEFAIATLLGMVSMPTLKYSIICLVAKVFVNKKNEVNELTS